jgi:hypothetical protein
MTPSSGGRRRLWSVLQLEDGEEVNEGRSNHQGITRGWGWRSPRMKAAAVIQHKTGDGGGAPVIGAGHKARGRMGGLPCALKRRKLSRGKGNGSGRSVAPCRSRGGGGNVEERGGALGRQQRVSDGRKWRSASRGGGVRACGPSWVVRRGLGPKSSAPFYLFKKNSNRFELI